MPWESCRPESSPPSEYMGPWWKDSRSPNPALSIGVAQTMTRSNPLGHNEYRGSGVRANRGYSPDSRRVERFPFFRGEGELFAVGRGLTGKRGNKTGHGLAKECARSL